MIVAINEKDRVYLSCSMGEFMLNSSKEDYVDFNNLNMWKVKNRKHCYMACGEMGLSTDLLKYNMVALPTNINEFTLNKEFVPELKKLLTEIRLSTLDKWKNEIIIVFNNEIFIIDRFFCVFKITNYCAFGYGENIVSGVLDSEVNGSSLENLFKALKTLDNMKMCKSFPFVVIDTKTNKHKIVYSINDINKFVKTIEKCNWLC